MKTIVIDPVTRIEGHAKITIHLDDDGHVADTQFHVTQIRGFEKFCEGRPFYEMPSITRASAASVRSATDRLGKGVRSDHERARAPDRGRSCGRSCTAARSSSRTR